MTELVRFLKQAVQVAHNCEAVHQDSIHVCVPTLWEGEVELFKVLGHADSQQCYAWVYECDKVHHFITVLASGAIKSPEAAVRAGLEMEGAISRRKVSR